MPLELVSNRVYLIKYEILGLIDVETSKDIRGKDLVPENINLVLHIRNVIQLQIDVRINPGSRESGPQRQSRAPITKINHVGKILKKMRENV